MEKEKKRERLTFERGETEMPAPEAAAWWNIKILNYLHLLCQMCYLWKSLHPPESSNSLLVNQRFLPKALSCCAATFYQHRLISTQGDDYHQWTLSRFNKESTTSVLSTAIKNPPQHVHLRAAVSPSPTSCSRARSSGRFQREFLCRAMP